MRDVCWIERSDAKGARVSENSPNLSREMQCKMCPVRHFAVCHALGGSHLHELSDIMIHRHFKAGAEIIHQDETSEQFAIVVSGVVKLSRVLLDGRQQIVGLLSEADCLGDVFSSVHHDCAECVTDVELCCFKRNQFATVLATHPELEHSIFQKVHEDLHEARQWMIALGLKTATEKVATFLLWLWSEEQGHCLHRPAREGNPIIHLSISREEIASFLGLTLETVSRTIGRLKTSGVIKMIETRRIELRNLTRLRQIAEVEA